MSEAEDFFEVEISDLRSTRGGRRRVVRWAATHPALEWRAVPRARAVRLAMLVLCALLVVANVGPSLPDSLLPAAPPVSRAAGLGQGFADASGVWAGLLARPLKLQAVPAGAACPATPGRAFTGGVGPGLGSGPAYAVGPGSGAGELRYLPPITFGMRGRGWGGQRVAWYVEPEYQGPVVIRGHQLDGPNAVGFMGGLDEQTGTTDLSSAPILRQLRVVADSSYGAPWTGWVTYTRVRAPGCYAYQVDGLSFSEVIVFRAVP